MTLVEGDKNTRENLYTVCMLMGMIKKRRKSGGCRGERGYYLTEIIGGPKGQDLMHMQTCWLQVGARRVMLGNRREGKAHRHRCW